MKLISLGFALTLFLACGGDDGNGNGNGNGGNIDAGVSTDATPGVSLTLDLEGFRVHADETVFFDLWEDGNSLGAVASEMVTIVSGGGGGGGGGGGNMVEFQGGLEIGKSYTLYFYADVNGDMTCQGPAGDMDHAWMLAIPTVTAAVTESYRHNETFDGDCTKH